MTDPTNYAQRYPSMIAGSFANAEAAKGAVQQLQQQLGLGSEQIDLVHPGDQQFDQKLEPDSRGIGRSVANTLILSGSVGVIAGCALGVLALSSGILAFDWSPYFTLLMATLIGGFLGLAVGGVLSLRPDHERVINRVRQQLEAQRWVVLVHTSNRRQFRRVRAYLGNDTVASW